jgi:hypothetical protein
MAPIPFSISLIKSGLTIANEAKSSVSVTAKKNNFLYGLL